MKYQCTHDACVAEWKFCKFCGFEASEAEKRKKIPLTLCEDGLKRKILIPPEKRKD